MEYVVAVLAVVAVALFVAVPLRRGGSSEPATVAAAADLEDLEARKLAKYREIRDTELDHAQGKIDEQDFKRQDTELRAEAVEILEALERLKSGATGEGSLALAEAGEEGAEPGQKTRA